MRMVRIAEVYRSLNRAIEPKSKHQLGFGIDQMHVGQVGVEPHGLPGCGNTRRLASRTNFDAVDAEEHHRFHAHRLDHIERRRKLAMRIAAFAAWLGDVFRTKSEYQRLADGFPVVFRALPR